MAFCGEAHCISPSHTYPATRPISQKSGPGWSEGPDDGLPQPSHRWPHIAQACCLQWGRCPVGWMKPKSRRAGPGPNKAGNSLLSHPHLPEVGQDPSLKECVDLIRKKKKCRPLRNAWCKLWRKARPGGVGCLLHAWLSHEQWHAEAPEMRAGGVFRSWGQMQRVSPQNLLEVLSLRCFPKNSA